MNVACSICLESFTLTSDIYTTPCGHVFHYECIRKWLESGNQHCSQCRQDCTIDEIVKLYFSENESALENNDLCTQLESENLKLQQEVNALKARELGANQKCVALEKENKKLHTAFCQSRSNCAGMDRVLKVQRSEIYSKNQKISELEAAVKSSLKTTNDSNSAAAPFSGAGEDTGEQETTQAKQAQATITNDMAGAIIGPGGSRIREILSFLSKSKR